MSNRRINVSALEFDQIKQNLKEFLRGQSQFSDYDFEGSNLSILLDVLAYNTHYNALYTNMALNESFLDTASKRNSVVSLAKALGYVPRSSRSARASVSFVVSNYPGGVLPSFLTIQKHTPFSGLKESVRYTFYTKSTVTAQKTTQNTYVFTDVVLVEGSPSVSRFVFSEQNAFLLNNANVDTSTLSVTVRESASSSSYEVYNIATDFTSINGESLVYFLKETDDGLYEVSFGDDVVGKRPSLGSIITVEYFVSSGDAPNDITALAYVGSSEYGNVTITSTQKANGGSFPEPIESIRFNAPQIYAAQNRAVTSLDYEAIIKSKIPYIGEVSVWGGELNNPPVYGKVFVSAKTVSEENLTFAEKQAATRALDPFKTVTAVIEFVDPTYIDVEVDAVVYYDPALTTKSSLEVQTLVTAVINQYNQDDLKKFNKIFRSSVLNRLIDESEVAITSSVLRLKLHRNVTPFFNTNHKYEVKIGTPLEKGTFYSNGFNQGTSGIEYFLRDDSNGVVASFYYEAGVLKKQADVGYIDYNAGTVVLTSLNISNTTSPNWQFRAVPASYDVVSAYNQIVRIDADKVRVSTVVDSTSNGQALTGNSFQFVPTKL